MLASGGLLVARYRIGEPHINDGRVCKMGRARWKAARRRATAMSVIEKRRGFYASEYPAVFRLEKGIQTYAGKYPAVFFSLYGLMRKDRRRVVSPDTQLVIEGFPRSANSFATRAFRMAQKEKVRVAHGLHVPAQVIRAARWEIPTLVLVRKPKDAILSFVLRDPISVDQALRYYLSFYETVEKYRDAYVLGLFEEVTEDYGEVIKRVNDKFGTAFSLFDHNERNVDRVFARFEKTSRRNHGEKYWETKVSRPSAVKERMKQDVRYDLESPGRKRLIAEAEAVYGRLTSPMRKPVPGEQPGR
jgi:hypothetical protein